MIAVNATAVAPDQSFAAAPVQRLDRPAVQPATTASGVSEAVFRKSSPQPVPTMHVAASAIPATAPTPLSSPPVQSVLMDMNIDVTTTSLSSASAQLGQAIIGLLAQPDSFHEAAVPAESSDKPPAVLAAPPASHGSVNPAGIADLLVVREHVLRYEPGEIAFVENVAAGETFKRQTVRKNTTDNSTLTTNFSGSQTERDLQISDRFNLQAQSQAALTDNSAPGVSASSAYGPLVDGSGSTGQAGPQAATFGQDVTSRAVTKLIASTQTQVFQQTTSEFDETVEHDFDNTAATAPEIVVYQWLDKIVQAKVFSYGKRVLYDFVIPEPRAEDHHRQNLWR